MSETCFSDRCTNLSRSRSHHYLPRTRPEVDREHLYAVVDLINQTQTAPFTKDQWSAILDASASHFHEAAELKSLHEASIVRQHRSRGVIPLDLHLALNERPPPRLRRPDSVVSGSARSLTQSELWAPPWGGGGGRPQAAASSPRPAPPVALQPSAAADSRLVLWRASGAASDTAHPSGDHGGP